MSTRTPIRLSATTGLNLFRECPRCFWLHHNKGIHRPQGIFPSLPGGMDRVIKLYFDQYRGSLPPELEGKVEGSLVSDISLLNRWRYWRTGLSYHDTSLGATLSGALDDCLTNGTLYIALDYKTKGSAPKAGDSEKYYQTQLDTYTFLLEANGYPAADHAYVVYYHPKTVLRDGVVHFHVEPVKVATNANRARTLFEDAVKFLRGPVPAHHSTCDWCTWNQELSEFE